MAMLRWLLEGGAVPLLLVACGVFFLFYLRGEPFRSPKWMLKTLTAKSPGGGVSPRRALLLALAGTLGVGNLVGVANAIWLGGAGAVFWMWISALLAMILKYAEIVLAVAHRRTGRHGFFGGAYYYIKDAFVRLGRHRTAVWFSGAFAVLMVVDALSTGCMIQANAVSRAVQGVWALSPWTVGVLLAVLTVPLLLRGTKSISALTEVLVPIMTLGYLILSAAVLVLRREAVGDALADIVRSACSKEAFGGGLMGFLTSRALRVGTMRGLLSNEAGCGTAPTAHAAADCRSAAGQGVWGILEVFVDTLLLCSATALVVLVSYEEVAMLGEDAMMMSIRAYSVVLGDWSEWFFCAAVWCFAWATLLCWANYGMESVQFLSRKPWVRPVYVLTFGICIVLGSVLAPHAVWVVADVAIAALTTVNLGILFLMRREIRHETLHREELL